MTRFILSGCNGKMGRVIAACVANRCDCEVVAGFDINTESHGGFPVYANPANCNVEADVLIDFSHPSALAGILAYAKEHRMPAVIATTGLTPEQQEEIKAAAAVIPVFFSANMSLGINLMMQLVKRASAVLGESFDVEIVEKHHRRKVDAPSGTALMLADAAASALPYEAENVFERHSVRQPRRREEIGISSVRGGTIVGEHEVIFAGHDEVFEMKHSALSREVFASGAIAAAKFIATVKAPGMYDMDDLLRDVVK